MSNAMPYVMRYGAVFDLNVTLLAKHCIIGLYDL